MCLVAELVCPRLIQIEAILKSSGNKHSSKTKELHFVNKKQQKSNRWVFDLKALIIDGTTGNRYGAKKTHREIVIIFLISSIRRFQ